jgi:hypothetical protein
MLAVAHECTIATQLSCQCRLVEGTAVRHAATPLSLGPWHLVWLGVNVLLRLYAPSSTSVLAG